MIPLIFFLFYIAKISQQKLLETASSPPVDVTITSKHDNTYRYNLTFNYETINRSKDFYFVRYRQLNNDNTAIEQSDVQTTVKDIHALCFPSKTRPNGCQPLLSQGMISKRINSKEEQVQLLPPLPCVSGLPCPYKKFRCTKGHEWKAVDGSPVCFYCPTCRSSDSIKGLKRDVGTSNLRRVNAFDRERVISLLLQTVAASDETRQDPQQVLRKKKKNTTNTNTNTMVVGVQEEEKEQHSHRIGGQDTTPRCANYDHISDWSNKVELSCSRGHIWAASVVNVVYGRTWCRRCQQEDKALSERDFHITAERMGGTFLGFSSPTDPDSKGRLTLYRQKATWRCGRGHVFEQYINNIRRKKGSARRCSWCPSCRKEHLEEVCYWTDED